MASSAPKSNFPSEFLKEKKNLNAFEVFAPSPSSASIDRLLNLNWFFDSSLDCLEKIKREKALCQLDENESQIFKNYMSEVHDPSIEFSHYNFNNLTNDRLFLHKSVNAEYKDLPFAPYSGETLQETIFEREMYNELLYVHSVSLSTVRSFNKNRARLSTVYENFSAGVFKDDDNYISTDFTNGVADKTQIISVAKNEAQSKASTANENRRKRKAQNNVRNILNTFAKYNVESTLSEAGKTFFFLNISKFICRSIKLMPFHNRVSNKRLYLSMQRHFLKKKADTLKCIDDAPNRANRLFKEVVLNNGRKINNKNRTNIVINFKLKKAQQKNSSQVMTSNMNKRKMEEQLKQDEEYQEMKRQQRKLNFLITQTELFAHFMENELENNSDFKSNEQLLEILKTGQGDLSANKNMVYDDREDIFKAAVLAFEKQTGHLNAFEDNPNPNKNQANKNKVPVDQYFDKANQDKVFAGQLKNYQIKGVTWLVSLFNKGINGILADEMGLGKTVQTISTLSYLSQVHGMNGPFLIVSPSSTLHNWQQEFNKFLPSFKVIPYWGNVNERKILRQYWGKKPNSKSNSSAVNKFNVVITSYQLVIKDAKYFKAMNWQYMVLDEAQAIKNVTSQRWKVLLSLNCRNRLLLTGTPVQNNMAELWALLHFIMPTLFDSHDEFNEWFSKDIENNAVASLSENNTKKQSFGNSTFDQNQLSRLHMIMKPFILRRVKKDVESELTDKVEKIVDCTLTCRQQYLYKSLKLKLSSEEIFNLKFDGGANKKENKLLNLVVQFRKVCNHPDLFEKETVITPTMFEILGNEYHLPGKVFLGDKNNNSKMILNKFDASLLSNLCDFRRRLTEQREREIILNENEHKKKVNLIEFIGSKTYTDGRLNFLSNEKFEFCSVSRVRMIDLVNDKNSREYLQPVDFPRFMYEGRNRNKSIKAMARPLRLRVDDKQFMLRMDNKLKFNLIRENSDSNVLLLEQKRENFLFEQPKTTRFIEKIFDCQHGFATNYHSLNNFSRDLIKTPRQQLINDSGKMQVLDQMLIKLKSENHKVLIYSQMTKMIDILEEYLISQKYKYVRLDGSSKMLERKEMVQDFQNRQDIFVFLLSTRAGGIGINLTAADTVIFYDSDWNPTVDQQAMDRAHRLGQTRQVTVYRLICKKTVEERILQRAREKSQIQNVVISGAGGGKSGGGESLKHKEMMALLLDEDELRAKLDQKKREQASSRKRKSNAGEAKKV